MRLAKDKEREKPDVTSEQDVSVVEPEVVGDVVVVSLLESSALVSVHHVFSFKFLQSEENPEQQNKAKLISRIAKMGQSMFPVRAQAQSQAEADDVMASEVSGSGVFAT